MTTFLARVAYRLRFALVTGLCGLLWGVVLFCCFLVLNYQIHGADSQSEFERWFVFHQVTVSWVYRIYETPIFLPLTLAWPDSL